MGIQGLTTFISRNSNHSLETYHLHDQCIVIDGNSLAVQLYQNSKCNSAFGGDYDVYAYSIKKFFGSLSKCNVTPYVIFDGGYEDKKMKTVLKRFRCRIVDASLQSPKTQSQYLVFPLMMKDVFVQVLISSNVAYTFCEYEADHEIAAVARYLSCPVLSYDSDFFVYNVTYVPFPSLTTKPSILKTNEGVRYVMKCKIYKVENFLKLFPGVDDDILPLIATLLGNDYVNRSVFSKFYSNLKQSKSKKLSEGQCRIIAVLEWLKNESFDSAIEKVISHFKICERKRIQHLIEVSCSNYTRTYCSSLKNLGISDTLEKLSTNERPKKSETDLNDWLLNILKNGKISARFYDLIHKSFYIAMPQAEDFSMTDSNLSSLSILRLSFDIMTNFDKRQMTLECRRGMNHKTRIINYIDSLPDELISHWINKSESPGYLFLEKFLEKTVDQSILSDIKKLPNNLQMPILSILWMLNSKSENINIPNESQIYSLLLCFINISIVNNKIGGVSSSYEFNTKFSNELKNWSEQNKEPCNIIAGFEGLIENNISYEDCMIVAGKLLKYFEVDSKLMEFPKVFKSQYLHFFAQFQCCFQQLSYLNILTSEYYSSCNVSEMYNGTFLYNMYSNLKRRENPGSYIHQLLECAPTVLNYIITLSNFLGLKSCHPHKNNSTPNINKFNKKSKKSHIQGVIEEENGVNDNVSDEETELQDINNRFNLLRLENMENCIL